jgi:hypothetical protein
MNECLCVTRLEAIQRTSPLCPNYAGLASVNPADHQPRVTVGSVKCTRAANDLRFSSLRSSDINSPEFNNDKIVNRFSFHVSSDIISFWL